MARAPEHDVVESDALVDALVRAAFATTAVLTRVAAAHDLSLTQLRMLGILRDRRLRIGELVDRLGLEKSSLTGLVGRAEARGLLGRAPSGTDGRAVEIFLSPDGRRLARRLTAQVSAELAPLFAPLGPAERRRLTALAEKMLAPTGA